MALPILHTERANAMLERMAFELYERNFDAPALILLGVSVRGPYLAERLAVRLREISGKQVHLGQLDNLSGVPFSEQTPIVLIDDVLYTGTTLFRSLRPLMEVPCAALQIGVLIDRGHRKVPVSADFVGMHLATTLQEYVHVTIDPAQHTILGYLE